MKSGSAQGSPPPATAAGAMPAERSSAPAARLLERLRSLQQEAAGEHPDPGSRYPTPRAFADAREFASRLDLNSCGSPVVSMAGDGELNFFWHRERDGLQAALGFCGAGAHSRCARKGGTEVFADDVPAGNGLRDDLAALLQEERPPRQSCTIAAWPAPTTRC